VHNACREQLDISEAGSLAEDDIPIAEYGHDDWEGELRHNAVEASGSVYAIRRKQALDAANLAPAPPHGLFPDDRGRRRL